MKNFLFILILIPILLFAQDKESTIEKFDELKNNKESIESLQKEFLELHKKYNYQIIVNEQTLNSISNQIGAATYNLTLFGILFAIAGFGLGLYVTNIERKTVSIRDETRELLKQTLTTKKEVISINDKIQNDIYGLFQKIKREETVHILSRLLKIPEDIANFSESLLSRDLERDDFKILKEAYIKLSDIVNLTPEQISAKVRFKKSYHLLFYQHFLDLCIKDEQIGNEVINFINTGIDCSFENDIIKSSGDFIRGIIDAGFQSKGNEINAFVMGLSKSSFKNVEKIYKILFNGLKNRNDQFIFFEMISDDKNSKIGKSNYGNLLIENYYGEELSKSEKLIIEHAKKIKHELENKNNPK